ncbi:hypothetical protein GLOTRDRAFT_131380 [Gloeophyllum trabeum ATCC 11539]|uniref:P-loop containing nucleoside triphosphate hydrolase protein n=1 Tax=Gloeophyllum trabeum (strain ATCC 11539 / FP-39264 / Madison 617) TaxID=670483 RepID=S7Q082_GLOTA|nr:uncharacterized protein GLOTRDRAFT_131380 [Gloeophyllum trabeum ATCC 11539]EPQ53098.1 hypothetical protein GLOTRDRAFT_131380 [Gloeophyllum trabeum ATCC 11539]
MPSTTMQQKPRKSFRFLDGVDMRPPWLQDVKQEPADTVPPKPRKSFRVIDGEDMKPPWIANKPIVSVVESPPVRHGKPKIPKLKVVPIEKPPVSDNNTADRESTLADNLSILADDPKALLPDVITHHDEYKVLKELETVPGFAPHVKLLPHQTIARQWMAHRERENRRGGIVADDMGLGKTVQALVRVVEGRATTSDRKEGWSGATLIVCPAALIRQWARESAKFAPGLRVLNHHDSKRTSEPRILTNADIVITTYGIVKSEYNAYEAGELRSALFNVPWLRIILDEAHEIRNRKTAGAEACWELMGKYKWCLTGTPIQNKVEDLYPLLNFIDVRPLNDWDIFNERIANPVKRGIDITAMKRLHVVLNGVLMRRRKDTMLNGTVIVKLPPRNVHLVLCRFTKEEREFYRVVEEWIVNQVWELVEIGEVQSRYINVLTWLLRLRQACDHPRLFHRPDEDETETNVKDAKNEVDSAEFTVLPHRWQRPILPSGARASSKARGARMPTALHFPPGSDSAKVREILKILWGIHKQSGGEDKTIVYSQWTGMLDLIGEFLAKDGMKFVRYDGGLKISQRDKVLDTLERDTSVTVALVSLKAGGVGLNLTMCNNVILTDPWWNPASEDQAFDRVHRLGQERPVTVYKLTTENTIEGRILELQAKKRAVAVAALSGERIKSQKMTLEELLALFGIRPQ